MAPYLFLGHYTRSIYASLCFGLGLATISGSAGGDVLLSILLVGFVFLAAFVRGSASYSYAGTVRAMS